MQNLKGLGRIGSAALVAAAAGMSALTPGPPASANAIQSVRTASSDLLIVAPGRIGDLRMGTTISSARRAGWISRDNTCGGWTAGRKALKRNSQGEIFKAYPERIHHRRLLSMWAAGEVATTRGVRTAGLGVSRRKGSSVKSLRNAYPRLRQLGNWFNSPSGQNMSVYSTGNARRGYLEFFVDSANSRVSFVVVRTKGVNWRIRPASGC